MYELFPRNTVYEEENMTHESSDSWKDSALISTRETNNYMDQALPRHWQ